MVKDGDVNAFTDAGKEFRPPQMKWLSLGFSPGFSCQVGPLRTYPHLTVVEETPQRLNARCFHIKVIDDLPVIRFPNTGRFAVLVFLRYN